MILTGNEIHEEWKNGRIFIDPFDVSQLNPNSYNFRLDSRLCVYEDEVLDPRVEPRVREIEMSAEGYVIEPGRLYLACTQEILGSDDYAPTFAARSSVARLGMFINLSACLGDIGFKGQWTLQLYAVNRIRVYPGMRIGQMMWWRPSGEISLYRGKYQHAEGPRPSRIHNDFKKAQDLPRLPVLGEACKVEEVGRKFATLSTVSVDHPVPPAFCIGADEFVRALTETQRSSLARTFQDLEATAGAYIDEAFAQLDELIWDIAVPARVCAAIADSLPSITIPGDSALLAVRSSGLAEDGHRSSHAGAHASILNVRADVDDVARAVTSCWRSYYSPAAVVGRLRVGDFDPLPKIAVMVQRLVAPVKAGVAFTEKDSERVAIDSVTGLAEQLLAGAVTGERFVVDERTPLEGSSSLLAEVAAMARALRKAMGWEVDVEWAADGERLWLLQVRPATPALRRSASESKPLAAVSQLYFSVGEPQYDIASVREVRSSYVRKREPAYLLARQFGIRTPDAWLLSYNRRGLNDQDLRERLERALGTDGPGEYVVDLSNAIRQVILPRRDLAEFLTKTSDTGADEGTVSSAIVRGFIRGELGVISRLQGEDIVLDVSHSGLLELNRGVAGAATTKIPISHGPDSDATADPPESLDPRLHRHLTAMIRLSAALSELLGPVAAEWVIEDDTLYFVDLSRFDTSLPLQAATPAIISPGSASGPLLAVDASLETLERASIGSVVSVHGEQDFTEFAWARELLALARSTSTPPLIVAKRPYAALAVLIGSVAGFIFEEGSLLCHLAIMLREAGVPAAIAADPPRRGLGHLTDGVLHVVDTPGTDRK
jgi:deoxycytidine triphosphate deaminase